MMMLGTPGTEDHRIRVGFIFLILGLLLIFWAWGSWVYRSSVPMQAQAMAQSQAGNGEPDAVSGEGALEHRTRIARAFWLFLLVGAALVMLVIFGSYVVIRAMRRYRSVLESADGDQANRPDVWSMHKVPTDYEYEDDEGPDEPDAFAAR